MSQDPNYAYPEDEINLFEVAVTLWEGKYWVALSMVACLVVGLAYLYIPNHSASASIEIKALPSDDLRRYELLNRREIVSMTNGALLSRFITELQSGEAMAQAILTTEYLEQQAEEKDDAFQRRVAQTANSIKLMPPTVDKDGNPDQINWEVRLGTANPDATRQLIASAFSLTNENVRLSILEAMANWQEQLEISQRYSTQDIETNRSNAIEDYDVTVKNRTAFLQEQLEIAQLLDIEKNTLVAEDISGVSSVLTSVSGDTPFYFRGYLAIQKEIDLIGSREQKERFIGDLVAIDQQSRALEQSRAIERTDEALASANITAENFKSAAYNVDVMSFTSSVKRNIVLALAAMFGLFAGSIGYLFWRGMRNFKRSETA